MQILDMRNRASDYIPDTCVMALLHSVTLNRYNYRTGVPLTLKSCEQGLGDKGTITYVLNSLI